MEKALSEDEWLLAREAVREHGASKEMLLRMCKTLDMLFDKAEQLRNRRDYGQELVGTG